jgi:hypothetical protein
VGVYSAIMNTQVYYTSGARESPPPSWTRRSPHIRGERVSSAIMNTQVYHTSVVRESKMPAGGNAPNTTERYNSSIETIMSPVGWWHNLQHAANRKWSIFNVWKPVAGLNIRFKKNQTFFSIGQVVFPPGKQHTGQKLLRCTLL